MLPQASLKAYLCLLNLPSQLRRSQLWLRSCARACPGLQVSRHRIQPCQGADFPAKAAFLLLSDGCFPTAQLPVCVAEQMPPQLGAVVIARKETVTEEADAEVPSSLQLSTAVFVRWCWCARGCRASFSLMELCEGQALGCDTKSFLDSLLRNTKGCG